MGKVGELICLLYIKGFLKLKSGSEKKRSASLDARNLKLAARAISFRSVIFRFHFLQLKGFRGGLEMIKLA